MTEQYIISTFYKFVHLPDYHSWQETLLAVGKTHGVKGSILLAEEGINATIAGSREGVDELLATLRRDYRFSDLLTKESSADFMPFLRYKVRLKKEIVTFKQPEADPTEIVGRYVAPAEWNALITQPDVIVVDTRNDFEYEIGTFTGSINPRTESFSELVSFVEAQLDPTVHKKVAMFCTGGIRCEKATAYLRQRGFEEVYHLQGGILNYLQHIPSERSLWEGECFVFDERVTVNHDLRPGQYQLCRGCWQPITDKDKQSADFEEGVSCPRCASKLTEERRASLRERERQVRLAEARGEKHLGREPVSPQG